ncbi:MAG: hypothetical protein LBD60_02330 [Puniceicoccales bacterium]|nr:hypothetical protein [Puniceicoccales bacterium]
MSFPFGLFEFSDGQGISDFNLRDTHGWLRSHPGEMISAEENIQINGRTLNLLKRYKTIPMVMSW